MTQTIRFAIDCPVRGVEMLLFGDKCGDQSQISSVRVSSDILNILYSICKEEVCGFL